MSIIIEHNIETGEILEREMNKSELDILKTIRAEIEAEKEARIARTEARNEILVKLGLTDDEAKLLLS